MYEMLTGKVPFDADTAVSVALKHMQEEPVEPIVLNPNIPIQLNRIILKTMQKDPNLRYVSATEMIADLEAVLKNPTNTTSNNFADTMATQRISINYEKNSKETKEPKKGKFSKIKEFFEKHKFLKFIAIMFCFILIFILSMVGTFFALSRPVENNDVQIPDFKGMTIEEAELEATNYGLTIKLLEEKFDVEIPEGQIISQDPKYQNPYTVKKGSEIGVTVSKGQELVTVPKFVGEKKDDAYKLAKSIGLEVEFKEEYNDEIEKGYVVKQNVAEGDAILAGSKVVLELSLGIEQVEVPNLIGKTEEEAKKAITDAKLKWKSTVKTSDSSKPNGQVIDQNVSAQSVVDKNTEITITVNEFKEIKSGTLNINIASLLYPSTGYIPKYEKIEDGVDEETGETKYKEQLVSPKKVNLKVTVDEEQIESKDVSEDSTNVTVNFDGTGTVVIKVYIDGNRKITKNFNFNTDTTLTID